MLFSIQHNSIEYSINRFGINFYETMIPKEKALEIIVNSYNACGMYTKCKKVAILVVDEILSNMINTLKWSEQNNGNVNYWQEVKQEIEKL